MMTLDLPYWPDVDGNFMLSINESPAMHFPTQNDALAYAAHLAQQRSQQGLDYAINVEGADGKWRLFQSLMQANA